MISSIEGVAKFSNTVLVIVVIASIVVISLMVINSLKDRNYEIGVLLSLGEKRKKIIKCDVSQNNKIINLTNNECIINPNLYIDEYDVTASHSAWIGTFNSDELFYLMSRGINKNDAIKLLIKGFLTNKMEIREEEKELIKNTIDNYWR